MIAARMSGAFKALVRAVKARKPQHAGEAAIDILQSTLDLELPLSSLSGDRP